MKDKNIISQVFKLSFNDKETLFKYLHKVENDSHFDWSFFSKNMEGEEEMISELLASFIDFIDFYALSSNEKIKWTDKLIFKYDEKLNWRLLSLNTNLALTYYLLETYQEKWFWGHDYGSRKYNYYNKKSLSSNPAFPMDPFIIEKFKRQIDWRALGLNPALKVKALIWEYSTEEEEENVERSIYILKQFKEYWRYERSVFTDDNAVMTGDERTSLFDNKSINWKIKEIRDYFEAEISHFNKKYNESI